MKQVIVLFVLLALALMPTDRAEAQAPTTTLAAELLVSTLGAGTVENFENRPDGLTLVAQRGSLVSAPLSAGWEFIALGVTWDEALPEGVEVALEARVSADGQRWEAWQPLGLMEVEGPDGFVTRNTDLLFAEGRFAQLRLSAMQPGGAPFTWRGLKLTFIDGRPGPDVPPPTVSPDEPDDDPPAVVSRAGWGANEAYRFNANGQEIWPRKYWSLRAFFFHHTASNPSTPPSAAVRSIYYYHAVTLGWGDIGYHYLVDQFGTIYQGRYGTESGGQVVEAGHTLGYNRNTMGVSMIGNFTSVAPPAAQLAAAKELLAWRSFTYGINPYASVWLDGVGDISPDRWFDDSLLAHRDSHAPPRTTCPGDAAYAKMGEIRSYVSQRMNQLAPVVQLTAPAAGSTLAGNVTLQASASPNVVRVDYKLDNSVIAVSNGAPWNVTVDAASLPAGGRTLRAVGFTADNRNASDQRAVTVALAAAPPITPTTEPTRTPTITPSPTATHTPTATPTITPSPTLPPDITPTATPPLTEWLFLPMMSREILPPPTPPTPTPGPPLPPRCEGLLDNADFHKNDGWSNLLGDVAARYATEQKWDGARSLRAGMEPGNPYRTASWSSARRAVTLPDDGRALTLTMRYLRQSDNVAAGGDVQYLGILNSAGVYTASVIPSGLAHDTQWQSVAYDLAAFRGHTIYLYVGAMNNGDAFGTRIYVDDVQVSVCGD